MEDADTGRIIIHEYAKSGQFDLIAAVVDEVRLLVDWYCRLLTLSFAGHRC